MTTQTYTKNEYFDRDFTFTANGVNVDPATVTFTLINPAGSSTSYVYGSDSEVSKTETGIYNVRFQMSGALGAYAWTMTATFTTPSGTEILSGAFSLTDSEVIDFHYTPQAVDDVTRVRYHIQDTDEATMIFSDSEIAMVISEEGNYQAAVISLIQSIISRLSHEPDMTADWLTVSWRRSSADWSSMLAEKRRKFGLGLTITARGTNVYRDDTIQDETPDYWDKA